jgi:hypothetical protein
VVLREKRDLTPGNNTVAFAISSKMTDPLVTMMFFFPFTFSRKVNLNQKFNVRTFWTN